MLGSKRIGPTGRWNRNAPHEAGSSRGTDAHQADRGRWCVHLRAPAGGHRRLLGTQRRWSTGNWGRPGSCRTADTDFDSDSNSHAEYGGWFAGECRRVDGARSPRLRADNGSPRHLLGFERPRRVGGWNPSPAIDPDTGDGIDESRDQRHRGWRSAHLRARRRQRAALVLGHQSPRRDRRRNRRDAPQSRFGAAVVVGDRHKHYRRSAPHLRPRE